MLCEIIIITNCVVVSSVGKSGIIVIPRFILQHLIILQADSECPD